MEANLFNTDPKQVARNKPNYTYFFGERKSTPEHIQRTRVNNRFSYDIVDIDGDYQEYTDPELTQTTRINTKRVQSLNLGDKIRNIIYGSTTWRDDASSILAAIYAVEDGRGAINPDGFYTPSENFKQIATVAVGQEIPLSPLLENLRNLLLVELTRNDISDLDIISRQIDVCREVAKSEGTKYRINLTRGFGKAGEQVTLSPTGFKFDTDRINIWRLLTGGAFAVGLAVQSITNCWALMMAKYVGRNANDHLHDILELPSAESGVGWTRVQRYNFLNGYHASARMMNFIIQEAADFV